MDIESIRRKLHGGFRPRICTSDGREFLVPHPEFILITPRNIAIADKDGYIDTIDPTHIVSIKQAGTKK